MAIAVAVVASVGGFAAGSAAATAIGGGFLGVIGGIAAGAIVGGAVGAAGYAIIGEDPMDGLKAGAISGGLAGGLAGWGAMGDGGATGVVEGTAGPSVEAGTGNIASSAVEAGTGRIAGSGALATGGGGAPGSDGLLMQSTIPQAPGPLPGQDSGGFLKNMFSGGKPTDGAGGFPDFLAGGGEPMSETMKAATVVGGMQMGGSLLTGYGNQKAMEEKRKYEEKMMEERRARINNLSPDFILKYGSLYKSKYV